MKVQVHVDRCSAGGFGHQVHVVDLCAGVIEMVAVGVEKRVERHVEPLPGGDRRRGNPVLPVDDDLNVFPVVLASVVNGEALAFELPGRRVQLSMNLFRIGETTPSDVIAELSRRGISMGAEQVVGLCPAVAASPAADGRLLEGRLASAAASAGAGMCEERGGEEPIALAGRLRREAEGLAGLAADQDAILAGAERAAALTPVLRAVGIRDGELEGLLQVAARGLREAVTPATRSIYQARVEALDARLG